MAAFDGTRPQAPDTPDAAPLDVHNLSGLDFFQAAPRPVEDNRLGQLANSLGSFDERLTQAGRWYEMSQRVHGGGQQTADQQSFDQFKSTHTPQEYMDAVKNGTIPRWQSPTVQLQADVTSGQYAAHTMADGLQGKLDTGELNLTDGSAANWLTQQRAAYLQANPDPNSGQQRGFGASYNQVLSGLQAKTTQAQAVAANQKTTDAAQQQIEMAVSGAFAQKMSPADTWTALDKLRTGLVQTMHFEPRELDPMIFDALQRRASQDPNWVLSVGNAPRKDVGTGQDMPSLFSKGSTLGQVAALEQRAQTFNANAADQQQKDSINGSVAALLSGNPGSLSNVPDQIPYTNPVTGAAGEVSKSQAVQAATNAIIARDTQRLASGLVTPQQIEDEQLQTFAQAGIKQHQWAQQLNTAATGSGDGTVLSNPAQQGQALRAYQLYSDLRVKNPAYLSTLMNGKAQQFFNTAFLQQELFGKDPVSAMQASASIWNNPKAQEENPNDTIKRDDVQTQAGQMRFDGTALSGVRNPEVAMQAMTDAAWSMVRLNGMSPADAIKAAAPLVQGAFVNVNGTLVPNLHYLPRDLMKPAAEQYLKDWATGPAAAMKLDPSTLTLGPQGTGKFIVMDSASGQPVMTNQGFVYVTPQDLIRTSQRTIDGQATADRLAKDTAAMQSAEAIRDAQAVRARVQAIVPAGRDFTDDGSVPHYEDEPQQPTAPAAPQETRFDHDMARLKGAITSSNQADAAAGAKYAAQQRAAEEADIERRVAYGKQRMDDAARTFQEWDRRNSQ